MALLQSRVGEPHEAHMYNRQTYSSLQAALTDNAVQTVDVEGMTGNMHAYGSMLTALRLAYAMCKVIDSSTDIAIIITDCDGLIVDAA